MNRKGPSDEYVVRDDRSPAVDDVERSKVVYHYASPYKAPVEHRLPEYRMDVPDLLGEGMIINPLPIQTPSLDWMEEVDKQIYTVLQASKNGIQNVTDLICEIETHFPEFCTQFQEEEYANLEQASADTVHQIAYAVNRLTEGCLLEDDIKFQAINMDIVINRITLDLIHNPHVQQRLLQVKQLWNDMLQTPYRNYHFRNPIRGTTDTALYAKEQFEMGAILKQMGREFFSYNQDHSQSDVTRLGSITPELRKITVVETGSGSHIEEILVLIHELIHCLQDAEEKDTPSQANNSYIFVDQNSTVDWNPDHEIEAQWCCTQLLEALIKQSGSSSAEEFFTLANIDEDAQRIWGNRLTALHASPETQSANIPQNFVEHAFSERKLTRITL